VGSVERSASSEKIEAPAAFGTHPLTLPYKRENLTAVGGERRKGSQDHSAPEGRGV
jgi:hypothetical protein